VTRTELHQLTDLRLAEAKVLLDNAHWEGAYYLAGYAVECALKACIAKRINQHDFPPKMNYVKDCYTHNIEVLLKSANLTAERDADSDIDLKTNWSLVKDWTEESRYTRTDAVAARNLYEAITDPAHGVLQFIKTRW